MPEKTSGWEKHPRNHYWLRRISGGLLIVIRQQGGSGATSSTLRGASPFGTPQPGPCPQCKRLISSSHRSASRLPRHPMQFEPRRETYSAILATHIIGVIKLHRTAWVWRWHLEDRGGRLLGPRGEVAASNPAKSWSSAYHSMLIAAERLMDPRTAPTTEGIQ